MKTFKIFHLNSFNYSLKVIHEIAFGSLKKKDYMTHQAKNVNSALTKAYREVFQYETNGALFVAMDENDQIIVAYTLTNKRSLEITPYEQKLTREQKDKKEFTEKIENL